MVEKTRGELIFESCDVALPPHVAPGLRLDGGGTQAPFRALQGDADVSGQETLSPKAQNGSEQSGSTSLATTGKFRLPLNPPAQQNTVHGHNEGTIHARMLGSTNTWCKDCRVSQEMAG